MRLLTPEPPHLGKIYPQLLGFPLGGARGLWVSSSSPRRPLDGLLGGRLCFAFLRELLP